MGTDGQRPLLITKGDPTSSYMLLGLQTGLDVLDAQNGNRAQDKWLTYVIRQLQPASQACGGTILS
jgi:hypothetical protein